MHCALPGQKPMRAVRTSGVDEAVGAAELELPLLPAPAVEVALRSSRPASVDNTVDSAACGRVLVELWCPSARPAAEDEIAASPTVAAEVTAGAPLVVVGVIDDEEELVIVGVLDDEKELVVVGVLDDEEELVVVGVLDDEEELVVVDVLDDEKELVVVDVVAGSDVASVTPLTTHWQMVPSALEENSMFPTT